MTITVYIPAYNAAAFLAEAIDSVLNQTRPADEILLVDDASTDGTADVIRAYAHRHAGLIKPIFRARNGGVSAARNDALTAAACDFITYVDADDRFLPRKLEREAAALAAHPGATIAFSDYYNVSEDGQRGEVWAGAAPVPEGDLLLSLWARQFPRRDVFRFEMMEVRRCRAAGGYDAQLRIFEDFDLRLRVSKGASACFVREPLAERRRHRHGLSAASASEHWRTLRAIERKNAPLLDDVPARARRHARRALMEWASPFARAAARDALRDPTRSALQRRVQAWQALAVACRFAPDLVTLADLYHALLPARWASRLIDPLDATP
ncbi:MAG: glycosyltransferase [Lentisphaerae bacterium]|nr:glycosyltransferase [Lentisphaerota bacterium]